jgi:hypothetical protein
MPKQANGVPTSAKAGGVVAPGRGTTGAPPAAPASRSRKVSRRPRDDDDNKVKASAKEARPAVKPAAKPRSAPPALSEEEQIGSAKYLPRELPPRVFEEERFIFPETYGVNRVRLLVKDPHWLFAHWDVDPRVRDGLRGEKGERVAALARLTLRLTDDHGGIGGAIVLPEGARSWYLRAVPGHRSYRVELGITLPSGEYRGLTRSNAVSTPRMGPSPEKATRRASYRLAAKMSPLSAAATATARPGSESAAAPRGKAAKRKSGSGPAGSPSRIEPVSAPEPSPGPEPGGASDLFRR